MPLLWISIAFIAGAAVPLFLTTPLRVLAISGAALCVACLFEKRLLRSFPTYKSLRKTLPIPVCLLVAAFLGGIVRGETGRPGFQPGDLAYYNDQGQVTILAVASQPVENHDKSTLLTVTSRLMKVNDEPVAVTGDAILLLPAGIRYEYGDLLEVSGNLQTPPERDDFSYKQYLENRGVFSYMTYPRINVVGKDAGNPVLVVIFSIRDRIAMTVEQIMPQPEAAFLSGMLVGRDEDIPDSLQKAFKQTGTSHLVAISGFNITIVAGLILALAGRLLPKRWSVWAAVIILTGYAVMAGASPSVVRAAIMGALAMVGQSIGRNRTAVNSLGLAAAVMTLFNPLILRDIGFQLSVAATAGILLIGAPVNDWLMERKIDTDKPPEVNYFWQTVGDSVIITLSAQVATMPFLLYHFHQYPLIGILVNPFVLPVQPAAMILGGLAALSGMIWLPLGRLIGLAAWIPLAYTTRVVEWFSGFHIVGLINLHLDLLPATLFTLFLIIAVIFQRVWMKRILTYGIYLLVLLLTGSLVIMVNDLYTRPDGNLHIHIFRQGSDISSYIDTPGGQHILVTNRPGDKDLVAFVDRKLPILEKDLDAVIIPNATASSSILLADSLNRFHPDWLLVNPQAGGAKTQSKLTSGLVDAGLERQVLETGQRFDLGRGAELTVLRTDEKGSHLLISWGSQRLGLVYGSSSENGPKGDALQRVPDVIIVDHPEDGISGEIDPVIVDSKALPLEGSNQVTVNDGSWLEIRSDGRSTMLWEKAGESH
jgi:competence protein ComEC